jgi:hypothetical protein
VELIHPERLSVIVRLEDERRQGCLAADLSGDDRYEHGLRVLYAGRQS